MTQRRLPKQTGQTTIVDTVPGEQTYINFEPLGVDARGTYTDVNFISLSNVSTTYNQGGTVTNNTVGISTTLTRDPDNNEIFLVTDAQTMINASVRGPTNASITFNPQVPYTQFGAYGLLTVDDGDTIGFAERYAQAHNTQTLGDPDAGLRRAVSIQNSANIVFTPAPYRNAFLEQVIPVSRSTLTISAFFNNASGIGALEDVYLNIGFGLGKLQ